MSNKNHKFRKYDKKGHRWCPSMLLPLGACVLWIDDHMACFFPLLESRRTRRRDQPELADGASSEAEERSDKSSDMVGSGRVNNF